MSDYGEEIRKMMYVCGDCSQPSPESAALIGNVTQQQIVQLAVKAMEGARQRSVGSEVIISADDIFFLMRRDKEKVKRLLHQIEFKALAERTSSNQNESGPGAAGWRGSLVTESEFLTDLFGSDFYSPEDTVQLQHKRMERHDSRTRGMDSTDYLHYVNCRQVSFVKNVVRFRRWLNLESVLEHSPANDILEILAYLAYDTVRELVELSLLVRQDMERSHGDIISPQQLLVLPSSHPHTITSSHPHSLHRTQEQLLSPSGVLHEATGTSTSGGGSETVRQSRGRKRKKSVSTDMPGSQDSIPNQSGTERDHHSQTRLGADRSGRGIQTCHIREALRRLSVPSSALPPLATHCCKPTYAQKTLCI